MIKPTRGAPLALLLGAACLVGCDDVPPHTLEIVFDDPADAAAAVAVDVRIARGGCDAPGEEVYASRVTRDAEGMVLPTLERGDWAVIAQATDADCAVVARGCLDVRLPVPGAILSVELASAEATDGCPSGVCVEGRCETRPLDAGVDGGPPEIDAGVDGGTDAGPPAPAAPTVIAPWNGVATGSALAPVEAALVNHPLRPRFVWEASDGAMSYVVELTSCAEADRTLCDFSSPSTRIVTDGDTLEARPDAPLTVESTTPPFGARLVFRVGACAMPSGTVCSFAAPRYLDVGRVRQDVDGDGIGDLFSVVTPSAGDTELRRYESVDTGNRGAVVLTLADLRSVTWIGDYDGDGVGELAVVTGAHGARRVRFVDALTDAGSTLADAGAVTRAGDVDGDGFADFAFVVEDEVRVQLGGATWDAARAIDIRPPSGVLEHALAIAPAGDVDADGNADLAVASRIAADMVRVDVYSLASRTPRRVGAMPSFSTGEVGVSMGNPLSMTGGYDMDGNGRPEIAVARHFIDTLTVFFDDGSRENLTGFEWELRSALSMGLLDGTERARIAAGASEGTDAFGDTGGIYHVAYTGDPFARTRIRIFNAERFGSQNATVDVTGNGREDLVSMAETGAMIHVGLFSSSGVGGTANFLLAPNTGTIDAISR